MKHGVRMMLRDASRITLRLMLRGALLCLIATVCAVGCTAGGVDSPTPVLPGDSTAPVDVAPLQPGGVEPVVADELTGLGSPAELSRRVTDVQEGYFRFGHEYDKSLPSQNVDNNDAGTIYLAATFPKEGAEGAAEPAFAMYSFDVSSFSGEQQVIIHLTRSSSTVFAGLANYERNRWEWFEIPESGVIDVTSFEPYTSSSGEMFVIVLMHGDAENRNPSCTIGWVRIGADPWKTTELVGAEPGNEYSSLTFDSAGRPWMLWKLLYLDGQPGGIMHFDSESCIHEQIKDADFGGWELLFDDSDNPHICSLYYHDEQFDVTYQWRDGEEWQEEPVATTQFPHSTSQGSPPPSPWRYQPAPDMEIDSLGQPHIVYIDPSTLEIHYAHRDIGGWQDDVVDSDSIYYHQEHPISMTLDEADHPHLAYIASTDEEYVRPRYAFYDGASWHFEETLPQGEWGSERIYLILDNGEPLIGYNHRGVAVTRRSSDQWQHTTFDDWHDSQGMQVVVVPGINPQFCFLGKFTPFFNIGIFDGEVWNFESALTFNQFEVSYRAPRSSFAMNNEGASSLLLHRTEIDNHGWLLITRTE